MTPYGLQVHADTWVLDPETRAWRLLPADFGGGRCHAACTVLEDHLVICGGQERTAGDLRRLSDVWLLDLKAPRAWEKLLELPRVAFLDASSISCCGRVMMVFGGHDNSELNDFNDPMGGGNKTF